MSYDPSTQNLLRPVSRSQFLGAALALLVGGVASCATGGGADSSGQRGGSRDLISSEDLRALPPMNALQAVRRLRGRWLQVRNSGAPSVHVDGRFSGTLLVLENFPVQEVEQMQYRNARDATTLYGTNYPAGVIELTTRRS